MPVYNMDRLDADGGIQMQSLPEAPAQTRNKPYSEGLREELAEYRESHNLTLGDLGRELSVSSSAISKYLNGKPEGNVKQLESLIADVLKSAAKRISISADLFETNVTRAINSKCETIRKTNDVGGITGPAGIGKSCGIDLYINSNKTAIKLTATRWLRDYACMVKLLWAEIDARGFDRYNGDSRAGYLVKKFKHSNRLILVDNAHRLTRGALEFWFDFHDETNVPICFVGNPEFLEKIESSDQRFSRIGLYRDIKLKQPEQVAEQLLELLAPAHATELHDLAVQVIEHRGHARALKKQILLAREIHGNGGASIREAFRSAHTQLVGRDYQLEGK